MPIKLVHAAETDTAAASNVKSGAAEKPCLTIFTLPKAFTGDSVRIQNNCLSSWKALGARVEVIVIGDEVGIEHAADQFGLKHAAEIRRNEFGTPLISDAFKTAAQMATAPVLVYCNADVILDEAFVDAIERVSTDPNVGESFLAIGTRVDVAVDHQIDFRDGKIAAPMLERFRDQGTPASICCKEFFAFPKRFVTDRTWAIPDFAVGRGNWDNWMVFSAKQRGVPVVRLPSTVGVFHQQHAYQHLDAASRRRLSCYVLGPEAKDNARLAGGKYLIQGSTATHRLTDAGVVPNRLAKWNLEFFRDLSRFAQLVRGLYFPKATA